MEIIGITSETMEKYQAHALFMIIIVTFPFNSGALRPRAF